MVAASFDIDSGTTYDASTSALNLFYGQAAAGF